MSVSRWNVKQTVTRAGGVWPVGATLQKPIGADLGGVQVTFTDAGGGFGGTTLSAKIQGCNETVPTNWIDIYEGGPVTATSNGSQALGGSDQVIAIGQWANVRGFVSESGGAAVNGLAVEFHFFCDFDSSIQS